MCWLMVVRSFFVARILRKRLTAKPLHLPPIVFGCSICICCIHIWKKQKKNEMDRAPISLDQVSKTRTHFLLYWKWAIEVDWMSKDTTITPTTTCSDSQKYFPRNGKTIENRDSKRIKNWIENRKKKKTGHECVCFCLFDQRKGMYWTQDQIDVYIKSILLYKKLVQCIYSYSLVGQWS